MNKQVKNIFAILLLTIGVAGMANAQAVPSKVCHVASQELVETLPEAIAADKQLRDLQATYRNKISEMDREIKAKLLTAQNEAASKSEEENERVRQALMQDQEKLEEYYTNSEKSIAQRREDMLKPIFTKVREAINKVAREKGFDYVLDSTIGTGIIMADGYDLTPDVMKELGIKKKATK